MPTEETSLIAIDLLKNVKQRTLYTEESRPWDEATTKIRLLGLATSFQELGLLSQETYNTILQQIQTSPVKDVLARLNKRYFDQLLNSEDIDDFTRNLHAYIQTNNPSSNLKTWQYKLGTIRGITSQFIHQAMTQALTKFNYKAIAYYYNGTAFTGEDTITDATILEEATPFLAKLLETEFTTETAFSVIFGGDVTSKLVSLPEFYLPKNAKKYFTWLYEKKAKSKKINKDDLAKLQDTLRKDEKWVERMGGDPTFLELFFKDDENTEALLDEYKPFIALFTYFRQVIAVYKESKEDSIYVEKAYTKLSEVFEAPKLPSLLKEKFSGGKNGLILIPLLMNHTLKNPFKNRIEELKDTSNEIKFKTLNKTIQAKYLIEVFSDILKSLPKPKIAIDWEEISHEWIKTEVIFPGSYENPIFLKKVMEYEKSYSQTRNKGSKDKGICQLCGSQSNLRMMSKGIFGDGTKSPTNWLIGGSTLDNQRACLKCAIETALRKLRVGTDAFLFAVHSPLYETGLIHEQEFNDTLVRQAKTFDFVMGASKEATIVLLDGTEKLIKEGASTLSKAFPRFDSYLIHERLKQPKTMEEESPVEDEMGGDGGETSSSTWGEYLANEIIEEKGINYIKTANNKIIKNYESKDFAIWLLTNQDDPELSFIKDFIEQTYEQNPQRVAIIPGSPNFAMVITQAYETRKLGDTNITRTQADYLSLFNALSLAIRFDAQVQIIGTNWALTEELQPSSTVHIPSTPALKQLFANLTKQNGIPTQHITPEQAHEAITFLSAMKILQDLSEVRIESIMSLIRTQHSWGKLLQRQQTEKKLYQETTITLLRKILKFTEESQLLV